MPNTATPPAGTLRRTPRTPIRQLGLYELARQRTGDPRSEQPIDWIPEGKYLPIVHDIMAGAGRGDGDG
ncbi:hypothetical protein ACFVAJ_19105 [Agromyces sp. NPDC057679]|uniref:hypothetical protein n=1 Tax=Agromyces sp. NPDC057679 TaxID=3346207 RepID=UPI0036702043